MQARRPDFDFTNSRAHWAPNPEFAHFYNAISVVLPSLERFLNRTMAKAASRVTGDDERTQQLRRDIRTFIKQESNHYSLHESCNDVLRRDGYDIAPLEEMIAAEYETLWNEKSFLFCVAYCEGFETIGPPAAHKVLDGLDEMYDGADPEIVGLWKWHLMEEFEHRTVCYDVLERLGGGYFLRIHGLLYQVRHLASMVGKVRDFLIETDRARMTPAELAASHQRYELAAKAMRQGSTKGLIRALMPWYSPCDLREPQRYRGTMKSLEQRAV